MTDRCPYSILTVFTNVLPHDETHEDYVCEKEDMRVEQDDGSLQIHYKICDGECDWKKCERYYVHHMESEL